MKKVAQGGKIRQLVRKRKSQVSKPDLPDSRAPAQSPTQGDGFFTTFLSEPLAPKPDTWKPLSE